MHFVFYIAMHMKNKNIAHTKRVAFNGTLILSKPLLGIFFRMYFSEMKSATFEDDKFTLREAASYNYKWGALNSVGIIIFVVKIEYRFVLSSTSILKKLNSF